MWLNFHQNKIVLPITIAAVLLALVFALPASAMPALVFSHGGHGAPAAFSGSDPNLASQSADQYTDRFPTTTTILSDLPDPSQSGQSFTVSFRVTCAPGLIPSGNVSVTASPGDGYCVGTLSGGIGSCSLTLSDLGNYTLTAHYLGSAIYLPSYDTEQHTVKAETTTTILSDLPDPSAPGQTFNVFFTVVSLWGPTGTVVVTASPRNISCISVLWLGQGSCILALNNLEDYVLTATYSGDDRNMPSSDTEAHTVAKSETTTTILSDLPDPSLPGQPFMTTFSVDSNWGFPSGTVTVTVLQEGTYCTGVLESNNGSCILEITDAGNYVLSAAYSGDNLHLPSSDPEPHTVAQAETTTSLSDLPDPSLPGRPFTVSFSVTSDWDTLTGTVTVTESVGGASCSSALVNGSGSCTLAIAQPGEYTLEAAYSGDNNHLSSHATGTHIVSAIRIYLPTTVK